MVQALDHRVTLVALESFRAGVPAHVILQSFTVLGIVFEHHGRASEITHVMGVHAAFRVVRIFLCRAPTRLVVEHKERVSVLILKQTGKILIQKPEFKQASWHEIVFDAFILNIPINGFNASKIIQCKTDQRER
jgi:hypothetical protein